VLSLFYSRKNVTTILECNFVRISPDDA
jgi:hypothetical protein